MSSQLRFNYGIEIFLRRKIFSQLGFSTYKIFPTTWYIVHRAQLRSYAEWILSMRLDDAPTKSPITSIYTTTTLVWYLWLHRVGPKKWHFANAKDSGDRAQLRSYAEWILSMRLDDAPTKSPLAPIYTTTMLVWYLWLHRVGPKKWLFAFGKVFAPSPPPCPYWIAFYYTLF